MKFSLISDMHVDHPQPKTPYDELEEIVVVAGDTSNGLLGLKFLNKLKNKGHTVLAVDGNHEHYSNKSQGRTFHETEKAFDDGVNFHGCHIFPSEKIAFIGVNGWYHVEDEQMWKDYMNDSSAGNLTAKDVNWLAYRDAQFVRHRLAFLPDGYKAVVFTHTAPCMESLNPRFEGHYSNEWYWNPDMYKVLQTFSDKILVWCHGHSHHTFETTVHGVRVVCNPRGYPNENPGWKPMTIEVQN